MDRIGNVVAEASQTTEAEEVVELFLKTPQDAQKWQAFFMLCRNLCHAKLKQLRRQGYSLPLISDDSDEIGALAVSLLAEILESKPGKPFFRVFDFFGHHQLRLEQEQSVSKDRLLCIFISQQVRQELFCEKARSDHETANLKRRIKEVLANKTVYCIAKNGKRTQLVTLVPINGNPRTDRPFIPLTTLIDMVESEITRKTQWTRIIRSVFDRIGECPEFRSGVMLHDLLHAAIVANERFMEADASVGPQQLSTPDKELLHSEIAKERIGTEKWLADFLNRKYVSNGKLCPDHAKGYLEAVKLFLADYCHSSDVDSLSEYFYAGMPETEHQYYRTRHLNVFEYVVDRTKSEFANRIKENSIILRLRNYRP